MMKEGGWMLAFLNENRGTIVAALAVVIVIFFAVRKMVKDKKAGIGTCGQKCANCCKMCRKGANREDRF